MLVRFYYGGDKNFMLRETETEFEVYEEGKGLACTFPKNIYREFND